RRPRRGGGQRQGARGARLSLWHTAGGSPVPPSYVLIVDDDPAIRGLMADALRSEGYAVDLAAHGAEALEAVRARCPATVLLDLMMPVMDGFAFIEACRPEQ